MLALSGTGGPTHLFGLGWLAIGSHRDDLRHRFASPAESETPCPTDVRNALRVEAREACTATSSHTRVYNARRSTLHWKAAYHAPRSALLNRLPSGWAWMKAALMIRACGTPEASSCG